MYELAIVGEELNAAGCGLLMMVVSPAICGTIIARFGTDEQKQRWLPGIADGSTIMAFGITEPDAGSNSHNITTTARRDGGDWVLNGRKFYVSGVDHADAILIVARTEDARTGRLKPALFVFPTDTPGFEYRAIDMDVVMPDKQFLLFLDDVRLPADALVGDEDAALAQLFAGLNPERIMAAAVSVGMGRYALDKAVAYAKEREVWGKPIGTHQGLSHPLAQAKIELELAKLMMQKAAALYDAGDDMGAGEAANMAKYAAAEAVDRRGRPGRADPRRQRPRPRVRPGQPARRRAGRPHRAGQPRDDPELRGPVQPRPAEVVLMADDELVHYAVERAIATITLDSPANRNALSAQLVEQLTAHLRRRGGRRRRPRRRAHPHRPDVLRRRRPQGADGRGRPAGRHAAHAGVAAGDRRAAQAGDRPRRRRSAGRRARHRRRLRHRGRRAGGLVRLHRGPARAGPGDHLADHAGPDHRACGLALLPDRRDVRRGRRRADRAAHRRRRGRRQLDAAVGTVGDALRLCSPQGLAETKPLTTQAVRGAFAAGATACSRCRRGCSPRRRRARACRPSCRSDRRGGRRHDRTPDDHGRRASPSRTAAGPPGRGCWRRRSPAWPSSAGRRPRSAWWPSTPASRAARRSTTSPPARRCSPPRSSTSPRSAARRCGRSSATARPPGTDAVVELVFALFTGTLFRAALALWVAAAAEPQLREQIVPLEARIGREIHRVVVDLLGVDEQVPGVRETVQATLDLARGLGLANLLTDDGAAAGRHRAQWARMLDAPLRPPA